MDSINKFNKTLTELLDNIKNISEKHKNNIENNYNFPLEGDTYIDLFIDNCKDKSNEIALQNEIIFSKESKLIDNIDFNDLWETIDNDNKKIIWKYLHTLYIYSYEHKQKKTTSQIIEEVNNKNISNLDDNIDEFMNILKSFQTNDENLEENIEELLSETNEEIPEILNGSIGKLANEIAKDINTENINIDNPSKLLEGLFSGNIDLESDNHGIGNLVQNITGKIQDKLENGELNENDLFNEATNVMSKLGESNIFQNLFQNNNSSNESKAKSEKKKKLEEKREQLRKKLDQKKNKCIN
uniref:Uncharacterized protein n=1 Tax=viral metagenome TaxID=1070528 RepID=A0A6C0IYD8_9ZZZZ